MFEPGQNLSVRLKKGRLFIAALVTLAVSLACSITTPLLPSATPAPTQSAPVTTQTVSIPTGTANLPTLSIPVTGDMAPAPTSAAAAGLIAYSGADGNIYTIDRDGKHKSAVTHDADGSPANAQPGQTYQYPTWAPDGQHLAFMGLTHSASDTHASLITTLADGSGRVEAFTSQDTLPFYLFWSPNSQTVSFLGNDINLGGLELFLSAAAGGHNQIVDTGNPYYWDWSPDNRTMIVHTGGAASDNQDARLALVELGNSIKINKLDLKPGHFQAPAWSPVSDELVLVAQSDTGDESLALVGRDGKIKRSLAAVNGPTFFAWSPKGGQLALSTLVDIATNPTNNLVLLDSTQPDHTRQIAKGSVLAYFWSPDGQKIAYFSVRGQNPGTTALVAQTQPQPSVAVQVYDLASGVSKQVAAFDPTDSFQQVFSFFDQYQRSGTIWSPDSQNLVLAGVDASGDGAIYVVGSDGSRFHQVAAGDLAFWSWK